MIVLVSVKERPISAGSAGLPGKKMKGVPNWWKEEYDHIKAWNKFVLAERKRFAKK